jgi:hypothetical protein
MKWFQQMRAREHNGKLLILRLGIALVDYWRLGLQYVDWDTPKVTWLPSEDAYEVRVRVREPTTYRIILPD